MNILFFIFWALIFSGLFLLMLELMKVPKISAEMAMLTAVKGANAKPKISDVLLGKLIVRLSKSISLHEYRKIRLKKTLSAAGIEETPEQYVAGALAKASAIALCVIPCLAVIPLAAVIVIFLAILTYFKELRKADLILSEKREKIEKELPRFAATISQELAASRDVLSIIERYKKSADDEFSKELDILTADMRSSNYEKALTRFEARFNSPMLSDVVRGLVGVLRGDDGRIYFQMLTHDMKQIELQRLKARAMKIPPKIRVFSFILLLCFLMTYMAIIGYEILTSLGNLF